MITFKQLEAIYWIVELGSFESAAMKLNMSQSAISKRIQELEDAFDMPIFDRSKRSARLTEKGTELFEQATEILRQRDYLLERISSREVLVRRFRIGVTELTAMTWLPALVEGIHSATRRRYPCEASSFGAVAWSTQRVNSRYTSATRLLKATRNPGRRSRPDTPELG